MTDKQLTIAPGHVVVNDLQHLKETKFPELSWKIDDKKGTTELLDDVINGKLDYTIADSVAISLYQRVHPELAVALDVSDEQPVTGLARWTMTIHFPPPCWISLTPSMKTGYWRGWKKNISGMAMILTMLIPARFYGRSTAYCLISSRCLRNMRKR